MHQIWFVSPTDVMVQLLDDHLAMHRMAVGMNPAWGRLFSTALHKFQLGHMSLCTTVLGNRLNGTGDLSTSVLFDLWKKRLSTGFGDGFSRALSLGIFSEAAWHHVSECFWGGDNNTSCVEKLKSLQCA